MRELLASVVSGQSPRRAAAMLGPAATSALRLRDEAQCFLRTSRRRSSDGSSLARREHVRFAVAA
jgi:hypothetical protein